MAESIIVVDSPKKLAALRHYAPEAAVFIDISTLFGNDCADYATLCYNGDLAEVLQRCVSLLQPHQQLIKSSAHIDVAASPDFAGAGVCSLINDLIDTPKGAVRHLHMASISTTSFASALADKYQRKPGSSILQNYIKLDKVFDVHARRQLKMADNNRPTLSLASLFALGLICKHDEKSTIPPQTRQQITGIFEYKSKIIEAVLIKLNGKQPDVEDRNKAKALIFDLKHQKLNISSLRTTRTVAAPPPPFTTTKLLAAAEEYHGFAPQRTLAAARSLYSGCNIGLKSPAGLITHPITDSFHVPDEELLAVREFILINYGKSYLPQKANVHSAFKKEHLGAIRPTRLAKPPQKLKKYLSDDELVVYTLIWKRFIASQMIDAVYENQTIRISGGPKSRYIFQAQTNHIPQRGFLQLYPEVHIDSADVGLQDSDKKAVIQAKEFQFTQEEQKNRFYYTEALLYDVLSDLDITLLETLEYHIETLKKWKFIQTSGNEIVTTPQGRAAYSILALTFPDIFNKSFLRRLKKSVTAPGKKGKKEIDHAAELEKLLAHREHQKQTAPMNEKAPQQCPICGGSIIEKQSDSGHYLHCENYPERCQFIKSIKVHSQRFYGRCDLCDSELAVKVGRYGRFLACSKFPKCRFTKPYPIDVRCPKPGCDGEIIERITSTGRLFYGCSNYPRCTFSSWQKPINIACPQCGSSYLAATSENSMLYFCPKCKNEMDISPVINQEER